MGGFGALFSSGTGADWEPERAASAAQAQQLYQQQQDVLGQQRAFTQALMGQSPQAMANQQMLAGQLAAQAQGMGPSVARAQLAEATGRNVAQTGALMGSQRGAGANVGLIGRQAGMAGAQAQQQAAGQAATLRAQEQLAAQAALGQLSGQQLAQISGAQQLGIQGANAAQQNILNAIANANAAKATVAGQTAGGQAGIVGGVLGGLAGLGGRAAAGGARGGEVGTDFANYAEGGGIGSDDYWNNLQNLGVIQPQAVDNSSYRQMEQVGRGLVSLGERALQPKQEVSGQTKGGYSGANLGVNTDIEAPINPLATSSNIEQFKMPFAQGGKVPAMVSPGERYLPPSEVKKVAEGKKPADKAGEKIPGVAKVKGDSYSNDTVHRNLEKGGIVIPRSVMQSDDPAEQARKFVAAVLAKKQSKRG